MNICWPDESCGSCWCFVLIGWMVLSVFSRKFPLSLESARTSPEGIHLMAEYSQKEYTPPLESMGCQSYITDLRIAGLSDVLQECFEKYPCLVVEAQRRNRRRLSGPTGCKHADVPFSPILPLWEINPNTIKLITLKPRSIRTWGRGQSIYQKRT